MTIKTNDKKKYPVDAQQIKKFWETINPHGNFHMFQVFKKDKTATKYTTVKTASQLIELCKRHNLEGLSCISINPTTDNNSLKTSDITEITNILIDIDVRADRKNDGVSTSEDKADAEKTAKAIYSRLTEKINLQVSMIVDSGNGYHIYIPVFIKLTSVFTGKNENENKTIWDNSEIKGRLIALEEILKEYNNENCQIDCISKDIARRVKIAGTWNVKEGIVEKNYRQSKITNICEDAITDVYIKSNTKILNSINIKKNDLLKISDAKGEKQKLRPCFEAFIRRRTQLEGGTGHNLRYALLNELVACGYSDAEIHEIFKTQNDYKAHVVQPRITKLRQKKKVTPYRCDTLKEKFKEINFPLEEFCEKCPLEIKRQEKKVRKKQGFHSGELSNSSWALLNENGIVKNTEREKKGNKYIQTRNVFRGKFEPVKKLLIDGKQFFEVICQEKIIGNMKDILSFMRMQGGVTSSNDLSDCVNALISGIDLPVEYGHSAVGVYVNDGHLKLDLEPYNITDEQKRISNQIKKAKTQSLTKETIQSYIDILEFFNPYEILPSMSYGIMTAFGYALKDYQNILISYLYHSGNENGIGKSLVSNSYTQHLFGVKSQSMSSVYSDFRLADTLDCFCGGMTIDECQKYNWKGKLGEKIKQSAENPIQDKRGSSDRTTRNYLSRLVPTFTGNGFPISGKPDLVRILRINFDESQKTIRHNRKNSKKLLKKIRELKPIGFRLIENELKDLNFNISELIQRVDKYADKIVESYGAFVDSRRPTVWGIVYEGLKAWERICSEYGVNWKAPDIKNFTDDIVIKVETATFESKETPVEDFIDWLETFLIKDDEKSTDKTYMGYTLESDGEYYFGIVITSPILKSYNKSNKFSEINNMGDLARGVASYASLPLKDIYGVPPNYKVWKFKGNRTKRGIFIKDNYNSDSRCNHVTNDELTEENKGYTQSELNENTCNQFQQEENIKSYMVTDVLKRKNNLFQENDIRKLKEFYIGIKGKNDYLTKKSLIAFIKNSLCKKQPEKYFNQLLQHGILTDYRNNHISYTGGDV